MSWRISDERLSSMFLSLFNTRGFKFIYYILKYTSCIGILYSYLSYLTYFFNSVITIHYSFARIIDSNLMVFVADFTIIDCMFS